MWITQTYLGAVEPDAKVFVYYLFEDYNSEQKTFTQKIQRELEGLGEVFGEKVSLLMPNPRYAGRVEAEVRENHALWESLGYNFPGLLISTSPLSGLNGYEDGCFYMPFVGRQSKDVAEVIQEVRRIAGDTLSWEFAHSRPPERHSLAKRILDSIEMKPGMWGFRVDLRRLMRNR
ncbi:MAG: hypothetical protein IAE99_01035 [Rhodothermales bacterium]|nr:hypothetical protein [Rhodothermales bacterium]